MNNYFNFIVCKFIRNIVIPEFIWISQKCIPINTPYSQSGDPGYNLRFFLFPIVTKAYVGLEFHFSLPRTSQVGSLCLELISHHGFPLLSLSKSMVMYSRAYSPHRESLGHMKREVKHKKKREKVSITLLQWAHLNTHSSAKYASYLLCNIRPLFPLGMIIKMVIL